MKLIFWLLVVGNLVFFAVMKLQGGDQSVPIPLSLHGEKITLAQASEAVQSAPEIASSVPSAVSAAVSAPIAAPVLTCYEWGDFFGSNLVRASNALKKFQLGNKLSQRGIDKNIDFWVYIAPLKDKAAVNEKLAQLKARGITDYFVVQDEGEWLNAISLGVFKTRESAQNFLEGLRAKDIRTAKMGEHSGKSRPVILIINGLNSKMSEQFTALQKDFPQTEQKRVACH